LLPLTNSVARWGPKYSEGTTTSERVLLNETKFAAKSAPQAISLSVACASIRGESMALSVFGLLYREVSR
jgi:hypothetical protein